MCIMTQTCTFFFKSLIIGVWQPKADVILSMFKKLSEGGGLPLTWTCPGRRAPQTEIKEEQHEDDAMEVDEDEEKEETTR